MELGIGVRRWIGSFVEERIVPVRMRAGAYATALPAPLPTGGGGGAPADSRWHRLDVLLLESQVKAAHPKLLRVSGGGEREVLVCLRCGLARACTSQ